MLLDELKEELKKLEPDIKTIKAYWQSAGIEKQFNTLHDIANQADFWKHPDQATISKELQQVRLQKEQYQSIIESFSNLDELIDLFSNEPTELERVQPEIKLLKRNINLFKLALLLNEKNDSSACFLSINAGAGGTESQDWANMLLRMYLRFCEREGFTVSTIDYQPGEEAGIKSATLYVKGKNAYGFFKGEQGIHRLVRISPFDSAKRRHTSFAAVAVTPESPEIKIEIDLNDLRIDTYRASGAGGQHVNRTDSAVRITHIPTGLVTQCQNERSQLQNKETAMKMLHAKLAQKMEQERDAEQAKIEKKKIEWGSQIRSYVLHPYKMVKDHRTNTESPQPDLVLDGDLMPFIESYLIWRAQHKE